MDFTMLISAPYPGSVPHPNASIDATGPPRFPQLTIEHSGETAWRLYTHRVMVLGALPSKDEGRDEH